MVFSMVFMCFHGFRMLCRTKRPHGCCDGRRDGCLDGRRDGRCDGRPNGRRVPTAVATVVLTVQTKRRRPNAASRHATARRLPSSRADLLSESTSLGRTFRRRRGLWMPASDSRADACATAVQIVRLRP